MKSFEGRVVLVSGASSGIGEATALAFARAGATVFGLGSQERSLSSLRAKHPTVRWLAADVTVRAEVTAAVASIEREVEAIDVLVNNAGIYRFAPLEATDEDGIRRQFEVNVFGLVALTQAALPALKRTKGAILNVSSTAAHKPMRDQSIYGATKAAVDALTRAWALELAPHGIRVNAIAPGPTETPGIARLPIPKEMFEAAKAHILSLIPLSRIAASEEIAHWILALTDPRSTWLTGQILGVDGGLGIA